MKFSDNFHRSIEIKLCKQVFKNSLKTNCIITDAPGADFHNTIVGESAAGAVGVIHKISIGLNGPKGPNFQ